MKINKTMSSGGFGRSVMTLAMGSLIAQATTILIAPLLTRIFTPSELGIYTLIITAETLFGSIICGRYEIMLVSEPEEKKVLPLVKLSFLVNIFFSFIAAVGYGSYYFILQEEYREYSYAIIFIFIMLFLLGCIKILESYNNRYKEYKVMTIAFVTRTLSQNFGTIILGAMNFGVLALILSHTLGMMIGIRKQAKSLLPSIKKMWSSSKQEILTVAKLHYRQPLYSTPAIWANRFSYASIILFIESLFSLAVLGLYSISYKVLGVPLTVISSNVSKVFYEEASREFSLTGMYIKSFKKTSIILISISIPMVLLLYFFSPLVFEILFGEEWRKAGVFVQILAPMYGIRFIVNTITNGLQIVKKQKVELFIQLMFIIFSVGNFIIAKLFKLNIYEYLTLITITFSLVYLIYYGVVFKYSYGLKKEKV